METGMPAVPAVQLTHLEGFRFRVRFADPRVRDLVTDEPAPLGSDGGPNPIALLAAAIGNCLASSLLFCTRKARLNVVGLEAQVDVETSRNAAGRARIPVIRVRLEPTADPVAHARMEKCLDVFESFCTVTDSVRHGIEVRVEVVPKLAPGPATLERGAKSDHEGWAHPSCDA